MRALKKEIQEVLNRKMVFIGGPRQVGKTTLSLQYLSNQNGMPANEKHPGYLNWDTPGVSKALKEGLLPADQKTLVFDEIHKYKQWRNLIKGFWDREKSERKILVTGSARLDYYTRGGDSLVNRYRYFRLHPYTLLEMNPKKPSSSDLHALIKFGGFPEPLFSQSEKEHRLWQRDRMTRVIREDLLDLERVHEISMIELLVESLKPRIGSVLSIQKLREEVQSDHKTIGRWIKILENLYVCYRIPPYGSSRIRAVKKEQKLYFWDWSNPKSSGVTVPSASEGAILENFVASQLLAFCHYLEDTQGFEMELRFIRDTDLREIDFVVLKDRKPLFAVECKSGDQRPSKHLMYFAERLPIPVFYQIHLGKTDQESVDRRIRIIPMLNFFSEILPKVIEELSQP
jgi:predicted AAA+ superfamily ATPase